MRLFKNKTCRILLLIITITTIIAIIQGTQKYCYHVDELWGYGLANSYDRPQLCNYSTYQELDNDGYNVWFTAKDFKEYITVQEGETFAYDKVVYNQSKDSHPPLFYAALHTISSLKTNTFSKWYALIINIITYILCQIIFYNICRHIIKNDKKAIIATALWSLSLAAMTMVMFLRMYVMLTLFGMGLILVTIKIIENGRIDKKHALLLITTNVLGMLTHNYYYIFACIVTIVMIALFVTVNKKATFLYCLSMLLSIGITLIIFPEELELLLHSDRGQETMLSLKQIIHSYKGLEQYIHCLISDYLGLNYWKTDSLSFIIISILWLIVAVCLYLYIRQNLVKDKKTIKEITLNIKNRLISIYTNKKPILLIILVSFIYAEIIAKISPNTGYHQDRYYFVIYPYIPLFLVIILEKLIKKENIRKYTYVTAIILTILINILCENRYVMKKDETKAQFKDMVRNAQCVYIEPIDFMINELSLDFTTADKVFYTSSFNPKETVKAINEIKNSDKNMVIIEQSKEEADKIVDSLNKYDDIALYYDFSFEYTKNYCIYKVK